MELMYDGQIVGNIDETRYLFDMVDVNPKDQKLSLYELQLNAQQYIHFPTDFQYQLKHNFEEIDNDSDVGNGDGYMQYAEF